ncbi:hypothetical protein [Streptomyces sp. NPDC050263]|uniref:hypothetical protein n=1 Tax=Streptomyces sp. NPDC050263 TaxID=3155037 RepID=UPI00342E18BE
MPPVPPPGLPEPPDLPARSARTARTARFARGAPRDFTLTPDGEVVLFRRGRTGDDPADCLWALEVETGVERLLAAPRAGVDSYATDAAARLIVFTTAGALWVVGSEPRRPPTSRPVSDPRPDPTGRRVAYVHEGALRVVEADGTADHAVAGHQPIGTARTGEVLRHQVRFLKRHLTPALAPADRSSGQ